ncbi:MAG: zinc-ribbon domain-containing protein [Acidobacteria bacterium]|nr:zinc-ribbon domain-containing protein [Acidobacteriota bacterium]
MFCPKCAAHNLDEAKFCRACGADISLVPQALTGQLAPVGEDLGEFDERGRSRVERGTRKLVQGVGFLIVFLCMMIFFRHFFWMTFWFIFPAISNISAGVGLLSQHAWRQSGHLPGGIKNTSRVGASETTALPRMDVNEIANADTAEIVAPPPSVTEGTTRHLGAPAVAAREGDRTELS